MKFTALNRAVEYLEGLSARDRQALVGGCLAALIAVDIQVVLPLHDRRVALEQQLAPTVSMADAERKIGAQKRERLAQLKQELARRSPNPAQSAASQPQATFDALCKTLSLQGLQVLSLRALVDDNAATVSVAASSAAPLVAEPANPNPAAAGSAPTVYRHRAELRVAGSLADIAQAMSALEKGNPSLRLERACLSADAHDSKRVEARLILATVTQERTWLAM